jgi:hypothetical protein
MHSAYKVEMLLPCLSGQKRVGYNPFFLDRLNYMFGLRACQLCGLADSII